jgi:VWFA-related protein
LLAQLTDLDEAGLLTFNERVTLGAPLTFDRARVEAALDLVRGEGRTSLIDAAFAAIVTAESGRGRSLLILFSDGVDSSSRLSPDAVLDVAGRSDVVVYGVSVGRMTGTTFLADLATRTGGALIEVASSNDLGATFLQILEEFRQRYVLTYTPRLANEGGWRPLDVRVKKRRVDVRARPGYQSDNGTR